MAIFEKDKFPIFDTNIFSTHKKRLQRKDYQKMRLSLIVLYELTARPISAEAFNEVDGWRKKYKDVNRLIIPTYDDIWTSAKAVRQMRLAQQKQHKGVTPAMVNATALQNDALIARSGFSAGCYIVTSNIADFAELRKFMRFDYMSADDYFGF